MFHLRFERGWTGARGWHLREHVVPPHEPLEHVQTIYSDTSSLTSIPCSTWQSNLLDNIFSKLYILLDRSTEKDETRYIQTFLEKSVRRPLG